MWHIYCSAFAKAEQNAFYYCMLKSFCPTWSKASESFNISSTLLFQLKCGTTPTLRHKMFSNSNGKPHFVLTVSSKILSQVDISYKKSRDKKSNKKEDWTLIDLFPMYFSFRWNGTPFCSVDSLTGLSTERRGQGWSFGRSTLLQAACHWGLGWASPH